MIYLELFLAFLKIGAISFGGGYGMIALIREETLSHGWLTEGEFLNFIAVSESTPGPIAVNMATFIGSLKGGILGSLVATLGVVLPSIIIILLIAALLKKLLKYPPVRAVLDGIRPAVCGLILSTAVIMFLGNIFNIGEVSDAFIFDWKGLVIFLIAAFIAVIYRLWRKKSFSPIILLILSGGLGVLFYL